MNINDFLISEDLLMLDAMDILNKTAKKILFIVRDDRLVASLTDGDIRRWILMNSSLDGCVKDIANYDPKYLFEKDRQRTKKYIKDNDIEALPILNEDFKITSIVLKNNEKIGSTTNINIPVVIMAGGLGTRLYPYTKILPKPLIPVGEIPITEHIINRFIQYGIKDFYLILNHKKNMIKAYFNEIEKKYNICYIDEDIPLGTGGGLSLLKGKINSTFILSNCDILIEADYSSIYDYHIRENNLITMICSLKNIRIPYGVVEVDENGSIHDMREKPELSMFVNTGMYVVDSRIIREIEEGTTIGFPDIIDKYKQSGEKIGVYPISDNNWLDMGQLDELEIMRRRIESGRD